MDLFKIESLNEKIRKKTATTAEKDEYMFMLYQNNSITHPMYERYLKDKNEPDLISAAITIGGIILLGFILKTVSLKN